MKRKLLLSGIVLLLLAQSAFILSFSTYQMRWSNLVSGSGGSTGSSSYQMNYTVGQTAVGSSSSSQYQVQLGYWALPPGGETPSGYHIFLPVIQK